MNTSPNVLLLWIRYAADRDVSLVLAGEKGKDELYTIIILEFIRQQVH